DSAAGFAHPVGLGDHAHRIGHHGNDMEGHHVIKAIVRKFEIERVHLEDFKMRPAVRLDFVPGARQHVRGKIDAADFTMGRVSWKGRAGAVTYLEDLGTGGNVEIFDHSLEAIVENFAEDLVVEWGEFRVKLALVRLDVYHFPHPKILLRLKRRECPSAAFCRKSKYRAGGSAIAFPF